MFPRLPSLKMQRGPVHTKRVLSCSPSSLAVSLQHLFPGPPILSQYFCLMASDPLVEVCSGSHLEQVVSRLAQAIRHCFAAWGVPSCAPHAANPPRTEWPCPTPLPWWESLLERVLQLLTRILSPPGSQTSSLGNDLALLFCPFYPFLLLCLCPKHPLQRPLCTDLSLMHINGGREDEKLYQRYRYSCLAARFWGFKLSLPFSPSAHFSFVQL